MGRGLRTFACTAVVGGCSLAVDVDGLSSPGGASDAAPPVDDAGRPGPDSTLPPPGDGGAQATCVPGAAGAFCADFDGVSTVLDGWDSFRNERANASVTFEDELFFSPPRAARITVPNGGSSDCRFAQLVRTIPGQWSRAELSFAVLVESVTDATIVMLQIARQCSALVVPYSNNPVVIRQDDPSGTPLRTAPLNRRATPGTFSRVGLTFDVRSTPTIEATIDGEPAGSLTGGPEACIRSGPVALYLGPHCVDRPITMTVDDVRLTVQ